MATNSGARRTFALATFALASLLAASGAVASPEVPGYLVVARDLVRHIAPENNHYQLGGEFISFPGDAPNATYAMRADCSGFLLAVLERAGYSTREHMTYLNPSSKRKRPAAEDFFASIDQQKGFTRVAHVADIQPGDLIAHAMINPDDKKEVGTTGHVFLVDGRPRPILARAPFVAGTEQFEVKIIDSNNEQVGDDDTRLASRTQKLEGLGTGTIRLYADADGVLVGWARTFAKTKLFFSYDARFPSETRVRRAAIGRPL